MQWLYTQTNVDIVEITFKKIEANAECKWKKMYCLAIMVVVVLLLLF